MASDEIATINMCVITAPELAPFQHLQPGGRVFFSEGTLSWGACIVFLWQEETSNEEALASSPFAQWCLAVSKPVFQHGISRRDFFIGGQKTLRCFRGPRL